jgi:hypothetical protein
MKSSRFSLAGASLVLGLAVPSLAFAGTSPTPAPAPPTPAATEESTGLLGGIGLEASVGWDSHYVFRGEPLQENTLWTQLSYDLSLTDSLSLNITPWFLQDLDTDYNEIDLSASLTYSLDPWEFSAGYAGYYYPRKSFGGGEGIGDEQEIIASVSRSFGDLTATLLGAYSITRDGLYYEFALEYPVTVTDSFTLTPGVVVGADTDYYDDGTDLNHVSLRLTADYQLTPWCTLSSYLAGNLPTGHLEDYYDNDLYGGVSLIVVF